MRALVLYESLFGNTCAVAEAVAAGIRDGRPDADVDCRHVDDPVAPGEFDLMVLGAPTHFWGLTRTLSRTMESQYERRFMSAIVPAPAGGARQAAVTTGMRARLATLPAGHGRAAAAFDTRMTGPLTGGARGAIVRKLERAGYRLIAEPETFVVEAVAGPLRAGELERARAWGEALARALGAQNSPDWRKTMQPRGTDVLGTDVLGTDVLGTDVLGTDVLGTAGGATFDGARAARPESPRLDVTRIVTTTEVVLGAVLVARYLSRRPGSSKALVTMGPGGWVSMKGGTVAVRRGSRPLGRPIPVQLTSPNQRAPLWARVLSAVPLQALMG